MSTRETAREIEEQAADWLMRVDKEGYSPGLAAEIDKWMAADARRRGAFLQAEAAWARLDVLSPETATGDEVDVDCDPDLALADGRLTRRGLLAGGGLAIAASLAGVFAWSQLGRSYETEVGEIRRLPLADGSIAALNTATALNVALDDRHRIVRLKEGEAWFQVAKDVDRPFVVEAGRIRVQAYGTAFSVRRRDNGADVLVTEGVVEAWASGAEGHRVRLKAGEQAFVGDNAAIERAEGSPSAVDRALAWRSGKIDLAGETLGQAAAEFNRYNQRRIVVDPSIAGENLYGVFGTDDPESFADAVRASLGVQVDLSNAAEIRIGGTRA